MLALVADVTFRWMQTMLAAATTGGCGHDGAVDRRQAEQLTRDLRPSALPGGCSFDTAPDRLGHVAGRDCYRARGRENGYTDVRADARPDARAVAMQAGIGASAHEDRPRTCFGRAKDVLHHD